MWWFLHYIGRGGPVSFAMAAIDIALWDLKARKQQTPLWQLLGGHDPKVKAYAGGIDLYFTLDELLAQTEKNLEKGFRAIKMKVGRDNLSEDLERVSAMRNFLGNDFPLMVDANMGWTVDQAIRAGNSLDFTRGTRLAFTIARSGSKQIISRSTWFWFGKIYQKPSSGDRWICYST